MSMYDILAKMAALVKTENVEQQPMTSTKDAITEAAEKLEKKFKDWEAEKEPREPTEKEKEEDAELKAKAEGNKKTLQKIADEFAKKKVDEAKMDEGFGYISDRRKFFSLRKKTLEQLEKLIANPETDKNTKELAKRAMAEKKRKENGDSSDVNEAANTTAVDDLKKQAKEVSDKIDKIVKDGGKVSETDPLSVKLKKLRAKIKQAKEKKVTESDDAEWTTGTGGRAVRKGNVTRHYAGKGVYGGGKPYKHGDVDDDNDEEDNKPQAEPTAPKKRGRPKKVREAALGEKAVSKAQQQAAAIAMHAPKSKLKGASKEMAKMPKKELEKFAKTKHKGLPKHVKESREPLAESLDAIAHRYGKEIRDFAQTGQLDEDLYHALYDYYFDDMPYGVKKARTADPYEWISDKLDEEIRMGEIEVKESNITTPTYGTVMAEEPIEIVDTTMENFDDLNELARLAGLNVAEAKSCKSKKMNEEGKKDKPDFLDVDKDGDKEEPMKKALKDKEKDVKESVDECMGSMSPMGSMPSQDNISVNTNYSSADGRKSVSVTAEGEQAEALMQMLKLAGMMPGAGDKEAVVAKVAVAPHEVEVEEAEYSNSPDEQYQGMDAIIHQGNDLNREKKQYASRPKMGDNPMAEDVLALESKLAAEYESIKKEVK